MRCFWIATGVIIFSAAGLLSATARAANVTKFLNCDRYGCHAEVVHYAAGEGEANEVTVEVAGEGILIRDVAGLQANAGCAQVDALTASCPRIPGGLPLAGRFEMNDGDDSLDARGMPGTAVISGGRGDDALFGPLGHTAEFRGGPGDDRMAGGDAWDRFVEGGRPDGSDTIVGGADDSVSGDQVSYEARRTTVRADTEGDRDDGAPGELDRLVEVEVLYGGRGNDVLIGGPGRNELEGGYGRDLIRGGAGNDRVDGGDPQRWLSGSGRRPQSGDTMFGGPGRDSIEGGLGPDAVHPGPGRDVVATAAGADRIATRDGTMDTVLCGGGRRDAAVHDRIDYVEKCERHGALRRFALPLFWADAIKSLSVVVGCPPRATPCEGRIVVRRDGAVLGEDRFVIAPDERQWVYVSLPPGRSRAEPDSFVNGGTVTFISTTASGTRSQDLRLRDVCHEFFDCLLALDPDVYARPGGGSD